MRGNCHGEIFKTDCGFRTSDFGKVCRSRGTRCYVGICTTYEIQRLYSGHQDCPFSSILMGLPLYTVDSSTYKSQSAQSALYKLVRAANHILPEFRNPQSEIRFTQTKSRLCAQPAFFSITLSLSQIPLSPVPGVLILPDR